MRVWNNQMNNQIKERIEDNFVVEAYNSRSDELMMLT